MPLLQNGAEYLQSKGIPFEEIYVDKDPKAVQEVVAESGQMGVPFTVITKDVGSKISILGFDKTKIRQHTGRVSYPQTKCKVHLTSLFSKHIFK